MARTFFAVTLTVILAGSTSIRGCMQPPSQTLKNPVPWALKQQVIYCEITIKRSGKYIFATSA
jgi:hypothetical protein